LSPELKLKLTQKDIKRQQLANDFPEEWRLFKPNRYLAITDRYADRGDIFFKTRYQTVRIGANEQSLLESIQEAKGIINEQDFVYAYHDQVETTELRRFVSRLSQAGAIDVLGVQ
jgi:hypothetical protein